MKDAPHRLFGIFDEDIEVLHWLGRLNDGHRLSQNLGVGITSRLLMPCTFSDSSACLYYSPIDSREQLKKRYEV